MMNRLLIGQDRIAETLRAAVTARRVAHAYLFYGPEGSGKKAAALELAAALLCEQNDKGAACGACNVCSRVFRVGHPDVHLMMPYPNDIGIEAVTERLGLLAENPYAVVDFQRRPSLDSLDAVSNKQVLYVRDRIAQDLRKEMSLSSVEGGYRIAILTDADRMRSEAANAFLKLLEEPGDRTVFILVSDRPDRMLSTIRSRCQLLRFIRLTDEEVSTALTERIQLNKSVAQTVARMADGSFSRALDLASSEELFALRTFVLDYLRASFKPDIDRVTDYAERINRMGRENLKFFLQLMLGWLRDLLLFKNMGESAPVVNLDQVEEIRKFCINLPSAQLESMVALVEEATILVERNMNLRLTFIVLAQTLGQAMKGENVGGLVSSLSNEPLLV
ncbi:MAG: DNA polymerase III subunit delta' [Rhodothermia bacterium]|nr:MAG: DNA polymerase III subunit delta' [Rhodothermia bacterium]